MLLFLFGQKLYDLNKCYETGSCERSATKYEDQDFSSSWWWEWTGSLVKSDDTLAQWLMAFFTIAATVVLILTLRSANRTNLVAVKAAEAAIDANKIMRDEQRAWVVVNFAAGPSISYQPGSNSLMLKIDVSPENIGKSPAQNMSIAGEMKIVPQGDRTGVNYSEHTDLIKKVILSAQEASIKGQLTETLFQSRAATHWQSERYVHAHLSNVDQDEIERACIVVCVAVCYKIPSGFGFAVGQGIVMKDDNSSIFSDMVSTGITSPVNVKVIWNPVSYT